MATTAQSATPEHASGRTSIETRTETLGATQARIATTIIALLIPVLPLFMGGRTPFAPAYLADVLLTTGMTIVLVILFWPAGTRTPASKEDKLWIAFAAVLSACIILQALPIPSLARLLGPYPNTIWHSGDAYPQTGSPVPTATLLGGTVFLALWTAAYAVRHLPSRSLGYLVITIAGSALFQAAYGLFAHESGTPTILSVWPRINLDQLSGTFTNRNLYAGYLALTGPVAIWMWWMGRVPFLRNVPRPFKITGSLLSSALLGMALFSSGSRLGAAAGALGILCPAGLWLRDRPDLRRIARWSLHAAVVVGLVGALWYGLAALLSRYVDQGLESSRWDVWSLMLRNLPWHYWLSGVGLGGFEAAFKTIQGPDLAVWYDHAHSDLLEWLLEMGVVGAVTLALVVRALWRRTRSDTLRAPLYAGVAAASVVALGDFSWHMAGTQLIIACAIGMTLRPHIVP